MRTTISIADDLYSEVKELTGSRSFSEFAGEAIKERVVQLKHQRLAREMEAGYRAEAAFPTLDPEWSSFEIEGL